MSGSVCVSKMIKISETIDDMEAYSRLNDSIFHVILNSTDSRLDEARQILEQIEVRQLYKCLGQTKPPQDKPVDWVRF